MNPRYTDIPQLPEVYTLVQTNSSSWGGGGGGGDPAVNTVVYMNSATWINTSTVVQTNSGNWNTAYNTATVFQANSASFATNSTVNSVSSLLTPLTLTNTLTSQLLPTSVYQNVSGSFATIAFSDSKYLPLSGGTITGNLNVTGQILSGGININQLLSSSGGGGDPSVNTVVYTTSATWNNTTTVVQNNSASWFEPVRRFDYTTVANVDISYSGTAPFGTLDNNPIWKLIRLTYANNGSISNSASALNSWTGRLTASYT